MRAPLTPRRYPTTADALAATEAARKAGVELPGAYDIENAALHRLAWARQQSRRRPPNDYYRSFLQSVARDAANTIRLARALQAAP